MSNSFTDYISRVGTLTKEKLRLQLDKQDHEASADLIIAHMTDMEKEYMEKNTELRQMIIDLLVLSYDHPDVSFHFTLNLRFLNNYRYGHINVSTFYDPYQAHTSGGPI